MFTFGDEMPGVTGSSRPAPISSSHSATRPSIWESVEEVSSNVRSTKVASGQSDRASPIEADIPLPPLVANRAIRLPASFEACSCRKACIGVAMLPYQIG